MNIKLKSISVTIIIYFISLLSGYFLSSLGGVLHNTFWDSEGCWFWGICDQKSRFEGFIYFYIFFLSFLSFLFLKQKTAWISFIVGTFIIWPGYIYIIITENLGYLRKEYIGSLVIILGFFVMGYFLAFLINKLRENL